MFPYFFQISKIGGPVKQEKIWCGLTTNTGLLEHDKLLRNHGNSTQSIYLINFVLPWQAIIPNKMGIKKNMTSLTQVLLFQRVIANLFLDLEPTYFIIMVLV